MKKNNILSITRPLAIILGLIYITSSISKAINIDSFVNLLMNYGNTWFGYIAPLITGFEIVLGFGFIFGTCQKRLAQISFGFLIILSISFLWAYFFRGIDDCGCFGDVLKLSPIATILKNILMLAISWIVWQRSVKNERKWYFLIPLSFGLVTTLVNGFEVKSRVNSDIQLASLNFQGSFLRPFLKEGEQMIMIFNPLCKPCRQAGSKLNGGKNIVAIYSSAFSEKHIQDYKSVIKPTYPIYSAHNDSIRKYFFSYPTILYFKDKTLQKISHEAVLVASYANSSW